MNKILFRIYRSTIASFPLLSAFVLLLCLVVAGAQIPKLKFDASSDSLVVEGDKALALYRDVNKRYGAEDFLIVTYSPKEQQSLFSTQVVGNIEKISAEFAVLDAVSKVNSIANVPLLYSPKVSLSDLSSGIRYLSDPSTDRDLAAKEFKNSPIYRGLLTSEDQNTTVIQLNLKRHEKLAGLREQRDELRELKRNKMLDAPQEKTLEQVESAYEEEAAKVNAVDAKMIANVRSIMDKYRDDAKLFLGGVTMVSNDMLSFIKQDLMTFGVAIFLFIIIVLGVVFRAVRWVVLPMLACVSCVIITTGLMAVMGWKLSVISANFVALLLILTLSVTVHLVVRYRELEVEQPDISAAERANATVRFMFKPSLFATLTTLVAFASLVVSGIRPVIDFGWMMTLGVIVSLCVTFVVMPVGMLLWKSRDKEVSDSTVETPTITAAIANFAERFSKPIVFVAVCLVLAAAFGISKLKVENRFIDYFDESTEIYQGMLMIDSKLGGVIPLDIIIRAKPDTKNYYAPEGGIDDFSDPAEIRQAANSDNNDAAVTGTVPDDTADPFAMDLESESAPAQDDFADNFGTQEPSADSVKDSYWFTIAGLQEIKRVHDFVDGLEETGKTLSLATLLEVTQDILGGGVDDIQLALLQRNLSGQIKESLVDPYFDPENNETRITVRVKETSKHLNRDQLIATIDEFLHKDMGYSKDEYDLTGLLVLYNNMLQSLFSSQILTLGSVFIAIMLMFVVLFRSISIAFIAILPNLLAASLVLGCMGILGIPLDMMTITIAAITVGIGVDNSIHYIYRFRTEFERDADYLATMHRSHRSIGRAMFYTSATIIIGFSILVLSNFTPSIYFGFLTAFAMLSALMGNLLLLPQLLMIFKPFKH